MFCPVAQVALAQVPRRVCCADEVVVVDDEEEAEDKEPHCGPPLR